jgi:hypothetical protein
MQGLQNLLTPGEERIARKGDMPMRSKRGQAGFQQVARLLVIQVQMPGQFEDESLTAGQEVSLFPPGDGATMHPDGFSKLLLCQVPAFAKGF